MQTDKSQPSETNESETRQNQTFPTKYFDLDFVQYLNLYLIPTWPEMHSVPQPT